MKTDQLKKGQTLLTSVRKVSGGKFQIEIAELVENPSSRPNVAALLNAGDDRFSAIAAKPRRAWQSATPEGLIAIGIDVTSLKFTLVEGKEIAEVNMLNPTLAGERLHVRLVDSMEPSYVGQTPKQVTNSKGETTFFMKDGKNIYQSTQIVAGEPVHAIINSDERVNAGVVTPTADAKSALNA